VNTIEKRTYRRQLAAEVPQAARDYDVDLEGMRAMNRSWHRECAMQARKKMMRAKRYALRELEHQRAVQEAADAAYRAGYITVDPIDMTAALAA
jgi:hypothetical protein